MRARSPGFTLIELVVTTAIVAVIGLVFAQIFSSGIKNYIVGRELVDDDAQARIALERLSRDLRMVRSRADISTFLPNRFVFVDNTGVSVDYQYSAATQQLTRAEAGGAAQPLADLVQGLSFSYQQTDGVSIASVASAIQFVSVYLTVGSANSTLEYRTTVEPLGF